MMNKSVKVIGSGFSGLAAATLLADKGCRVMVFEKNETVGGRARALRENGYVFDMGPSWYWMPDVFEKYFALFDRSPDDYYSLKKLDPSFRVFFGKDDVVDVPENIDELAMWIASEEPDGEHKFRKFLAEAELKYHLAIKDLVYLPSIRLSEYAQFSVLKNLHKLSLLGSYHSHVRKFFKSPKVIRLMEFPILFLGGTSKKTPALFSLMNYAAFGLSTWYPVGGFSEVIEGMKRLAQEKGVEIKTRDSVQKIEASSVSVKTLITHSGSYAADGIIAASDYAHAEQLLDAEYRNYSSAYWDKKTFSPSCLIFYLGVNKRIPGLLHHNLFFDEDFDVHATEIYETPRWPSHPLFYVCCPSKTDDTVAPAGHENLFVLMPLAAGLQDTERLREEYFFIIMQRLEKLIKEDVRSHIEYKKSYCINDFEKDYNAYKGNAYGLANTLFQTAFFRPSIKNKKLNNLVYSGQLTVPGPGVPPAIISGQIAARELLKVLNGRA